MKKLMIASLLAGIWLMPLSSYAKNQCGVGPTVVSKKNSLLSNSVATTTDSSSAYTNLTAITFGTSGCSNSGFVGNPQQRQYVAVAYANLEEELAKGQGPYLDSLVSLLGCPETAKQDFIEVSQRHYEALFAGESQAEQRADLFLGQMQQKVLSDARLAHQCSKIS